MTYFSKDLDDVLTPDASHSIVTFLRRCEALPALLDETLQVAPPNFSISSSSRVVVTGAGLAEGPARQLAALWRSELGICVDFIPLTSFMHGVPTHRADTLIVCSQGLSPNAQIVFDRVSNFSRALLITSCRHLELKPHETELLQKWQQAGGAIWDLPPAHKEDGFLLRVQGPTLYLLAVCAWTASLSRTLHGEDVSWVDELARVPQTYARRLEEALFEPDAIQSASMLSEQNLGLLSFAASEDRSHALRWKLLEGLWRQAPQVFDLLQVIHGPWQGFYHEPMALFALIDGECDMQRDLVARLEGILMPHHTLKKVYASLSPPLGLFEFCAVFDALIVLENQRLGRDLVDWPGQGKDGPLYGLSHGV